MHWLVIGVPRSECRVRRRGWTPCFRQLCWINRPARAEFSLRHHPAHDVAAVDVHDDGRGSNVSSTSSSPSSRRDIPRTYTWFGAVAINSGFLYSGWKALRPAFLNRHLGGQNTIHRAFAAQVDLFVEQDVGHAPRRVSVHEPLQNTACRKPRLVPSRSMPGRASGGAAVARFAWASTTVHTSIGRSSRAEHARFYTDVLSQLIGRLQDSSRRRGLSPAAPQLFPARR